MLFPSNVDPDCPVPQESKISFLRKQNIVKYFHWMTFKYEMQYCAYSLQRKRTKKKWNTNKKQKELMQENNKIRSN